MWSIYKKEIHLFLSSLVGYIAVAVFLLATGLFMWVFPDYSVISYGFSSMDGFFSMAPYIFLFLIPAITMRSFAEEIQTGTIELLNTRPLTEWDILLGKFFAALSLVLVAILPTLVYFFSIYELGLPKGNLDFGGTLGSYLGLFFLGSSFISIGIFASSITKNQIVAFLLGLFLCAFFYDAFSSISKLPIFFGWADLILEYCGINFHYASISKGLLDTRDLIYFISLSLFFLIATRFSLERKKW